MLRYLRKVKLIIKHVKEKWMAKSPKQMWQSIYDFTDKTLKLIGIRVLDDMKNYWLTASLGLSVLIYYTVLIYTIQYYFKRDEYLRGMECNCVHGHVITVC